MLRLQAIVKDFESEVDNLRQLYLGHAAMPHLGFWAGVDASVVAYSVVRLLDAWNRFCRQLVLMSARGNTLSISGVRVSRSPKVALGQRPLDALKTTYPAHIQNRIVWEPKWFIPADAIKAASQLQIVNLSTVASGLGLSITIPGLSVGTPLDLRNCRNYYAHRSRTTSEGLVDLRRRLGITSDIKPDEIPKLAVPGGASLFEVWCQDLLIRADVAAQ